MTVTPFMLSSLQVLSACCLSRGSKRPTPLGNWGKWVIASSKLVCYNSRAMPASTAPSDEPISFVILDIPTISRAFRLREHPVRRKCEHDESGAAR
jgi:hypothetical protein